MIGLKTSVMGIVNVTPDSFSGGYFSGKQATTHAIQLIEDGADIIDVGAESTRPGAREIDKNEELSRLKRVLPDIKDIDIPISVDTYKAEVAAEAIEMGATIINDVHGLRDPNMLKVAIEYDVPVIVVHFDRTFTGDIVDEVLDFFRKTKENCAEHGYDTSKIIYDPGIGFNKTYAEDLTLLRRLDELKTLDGEEIKLLLGVSRKRVIGRATGLPLDDRDDATGAVCVHAVSKGVDIVRVHDVRKVSRMCLMADKLLKGA
ncbi:MAG: dihydropteroate synthase [Selenomonadaceae bacterium]|nr:dihydropteroate synthase [Selenomonadaceae bacterium]